eukprot:gene22529-29652_t
MSTLATSAAERNQLVVYALHKFRRAVRLRPDFDRGCYNLGTVYYSHGSALQTEVKVQYKGVAASAMSPEALQQRQAQETEIRSIFVAAAQYICLAFALQQHKNIYRKSLSVVHALLPLPFLRAGFLMAPIPNTMGTYKETWQRDWFVLDHVSIRAASTMENSLSKASAGMISSPEVSHSHLEGPKLSVELSGGMISSPEVPHSHLEGPSLLVELSKICSVRRCVDPTLPEGEAVWVGLANGTTEGLNFIAEDALAAHGWAGTLGLYFIAEDALAADGWADALTLCSYIVQSRGSKAMADALAPAQTSLGGVQASSRENHEAAAKSD